MSPEKLKKAEANYQKAVKSLTQPTNAHQVMTLRLAATGLNQAHNEFTRDEGVVAASENGFSVAGASTDADTRDVAAINAYRATAGLPPLPKDEITVAATDADVAAGYAQYVEHCEIAKVNPRSKAQFLADARWKQLNAR